MQTVPPPKMRKQSGRFAVRVVLLAYSSFSFCSSIFTDSHLLCFCFWAVSRLRSTRSACTECWAKAASAKFAHARCAPLARCTLARRWRRNALRSATANRWRWLRRRCLAVFIRPSLSHSPMRLRPRTRFASCWLWWTAATSSSIFTSWNLKVSKNLELSSTLLKSRSALNTFTDRYDPFFRGILLVQN